MHLGMSKSKNSTSLYVLKSTYKDGFHSTCIVEKLGTVADLKEKLNGEDPYEWAKNYIAELNRQEKEGKRIVTAKYSPVKQIEKGDQRTFNGGFLFLERIYTALGLPTLAKELKRRYKLNYDLNAVLCRMVCGKILYGEMRESFYDMAMRFIGDAGFKKEDIAATLSILSKEAGYIQRVLYENSRELTGDNTSRLYYDSTICLHDASSMQQRSLVIPLDIYFDGNMIPIAYTINPEHLENPSPAPLEETILKKYRDVSPVTLSDGGFTTGGGSLLSNWEAPSHHIVTLHYDQLDEDLKQAVADEEGWTPVHAEQEEDGVLAGYLYKEVRLKENGTNRRYILTMSMHRMQVVRYERERLAVYSHNYNTLQNSDNSFYADSVMAYLTDMEDATAEEILTITELREDTHNGFRLRASDFYGTNNIPSMDIINAHFILCFTALVVHASLLKKLNMFSQSRNIIRQLQQMTFMKIPTEGYIPLYTRNDLTDLLHDSFGFRTDYQIISKKQMNHLLSK